MKKFLNLGLWLFAVFAIAMIYSQLDVSRGISSSSVREFSFSGFVRKVNDGDVRDVVRKGMIVVGHLKDGAAFRTVTPPDYDLTSLLLSRGIDMSVSYNTNGGFVSNILNAVFSMLVYFAVMMLVMSVMARKFQPGGKGGLGFAGMKSKMMKKEKISIGFKDVAGVDEAKEELEELVQFLKDPQKFEKLGGKIPKGCLLVGPPGTGKTMLARAVAGEAKVPFFSISGSDFVEMFVGVGASRVRGMFEQGKKHAPCIIFIDEIDAVGRKRGSGVGGGNDEREQTLNQLLVEMDGFDANEGVIIIAATNRPDVLDGALLRPGRFDRRIVVGLPDIKQRHGILNVHTRKIPVAPDVDLNVIARGTPGFSGADLANLANEASLYAARRDKKFVTMQDFEYAKDRVMMGAERKSMVMRDSDKQLTAYHEAGHAIVAINMESSDPIHKVTIVPRGGALGMVARLPKDDVVHLSKEKILADITVAMGGRAAEEIMFGENKITSGAESDIQQATDHARAMIEKWGMSNHLGMVRYRNDNRFNSHDIENKIDTEVKGIIDDAYSRAKTILLDNMSDLKLLTSVLLDKETLAGDDVTKALKGESLNNEHESAASVVPSSDA